MHGTMDHSLEYKKSDRFLLTRYTNANYTSCVDDRKSTSGFVFFLGLGPISWGSKKQAIVICSSIEA